MEWLFLGLLGYFGYRIASKLTFSAPAPQPSSPFSIPSPNPQPVSPFSIPGVTAPVGPPMATPAAVTAAFFTTTSAGVTAFTPTAQLAIATLLQGGNWFVSSLNPLTSIATIESGVVLTPSAVPPQSANAFIAAAAPTFDVWIDTSILTGKGSILQVVSAGQLPLQADASNPPAASSPSDASGAAPRMVLLAGPTAPQA